MLEAIGTGKEYTNKYGSNNCPDKSANGMFSYAKSKGMEYGSMGDMPEIPGLAVRYSGHVGVYIGNGKVVEARGFNYGVVETELNKRNWINWYKIPFIEYIEEVIPEEPIKLIGLKNGVYNSKNVVELQKILLNLGYDIGADGADGDFGDNTEKALKKFQLDYGLEATGYVDKLTNDMLLNPKKPEEEPTEIIGIAIARANMYVRKSPDKNSKSLGICRKETKVEVFKVLENGWLQIKSSYGIGYTSNTTGSYWNYIPLIPDVIAQEKPALYDIKYKRDHITCGSLNFRNGAGTDKESFGYLPKGTKVNCQGFYTKVGERDWLYINFTYKNKKYAAFASSKYLGRI